jgi:hypothetical protein
MSLFMKTPCYLDHQPYDHKNLNIRY